MNKILLLIAAGGILLLAACSPASEAPVPAEPKASAESKAEPNPAVLRVEVAEAEPAHKVDSVTYAGVLPAADGPGIETTLEVFANGRFALGEVYVGRDVSFAEIGSYTRSGDVLKLQMQDGSARYYRESAGQVQMLDMDQNPITGELAAYYILKELPKQN